MHSFLLNIRNEADLRDFEHFLATHPDIELRPLPQPADPALHDRAYTQVEVLAQISEPLALYEKGEYSTEEDLDSWLDPALPGPAYTPEQVMNRIRKARKEIANGECVDEEGMDKLLAQWREE